MLQAFINMWKIPELRNRLLFTISMLVIYRIGFFIPLPAINQQELFDWVNNMRDPEGGSNAVGQVIDFVSVFTGGSLSQSTIFGLGIMPYISAAIIFQLLGSVVDSLKELQKEPGGRQKVQEWTRYATVPLCLVQSVFYLSVARSQGWVYQDYANNLLAFWLVGILGLTSGTIFMMWLGEQIDKFGIGNGVSLIITAGILAGMPGAIERLIADFSFDGSSQYGPSTALFLIFAFVAVVAGSIVITQGQRRIPIQHGKHTRGRRVYGGQKSYLPLRVNHGGVMPIIFASSLMIFPTMFFNWAAPRLQWGWVVFLSEQFTNHGGYLYILIYIGLIYFFSYFWTSVQFQPKEMATQLRNAGSFIPGMRPGPRTAEYLETVMERITYVGAGFLAVIAVIPSVVATVFEIDWSISVFLGGTGLLIVVSVMLDFVQRIEASLMMRNYSGFLASSGGGKGPKIRGSR